MSLPKNAPGLGLRREHYASIRNGEVSVAQWFEAISENYMDSRGRPFQFLQDIRRDFPVALHGVSLSPGSAIKFASRSMYLNRLKALIERVDPWLVSDHFCWTATESRQSHDLLPLGTDAAWLGMICDNVDRIQGFLGRRIALENVSSYLQIRGQSALPEWEFINEVCSRTGCGVLLDLNNVIVNAHNHGFSARNFVRSMRSENVLQYHLAGHSRRESILFDTHGTTAQPAVLSLYRFAIDELGHRPVLLERDQDIPSLLELENELRQITAIGDSIHRSNVAPIKSFGEPSEWPGHSKRTVKQSTALPSAMQELLALQNSILHSLFSGSASEELCQTIQPSGQFNELQSLDVYRQSVLARLEEWLLDTFVLLEKLTTDAENLQRWVRAFIESHAPIHYNLSEYGNGLSGFLRSRDVDAASLARIVYAQMRLFHRQRPGGGFLSNDSEW
ncbi:MAG: DUF692 family protein, partial [Leptospiraceae bacterium]|nr:DUF692 family protein [Leptospiraceae bacterium]